MGLCELYEKLNSARYFHKGKEIIFLLLLFEDGIIIMS